MASIGQPFGASGTEHASGLVPDPGSTAGTTRYLREDSSFGLPPDVAIEAITDGTHTVAPPSSLTFADGVISGSTPNAVYTPRVYEAGTGITLTPAGNTTTIESTGIETITDGTNTVSPANSLSFAAGVVTGTTPDAVYTPPTYTVLVLPDRDTVPVSCRIRAAQPAPHVRSMRMAPGIHHRGTTSTRSPMVRTP